MDFIPFYIVLSFYSHLHVPRFETCIDNDNRNEEKNKHQKNVSVASKLCVSMPFVHRGIVIEF